MSFQKKCVKYIMRYAINMNLYYINLLLFKLPNLFTNFNYGGSLSSTTYDGRDYYVMVKESFLVKL